MVKVSVIVPIYNVEAYLTKCLDSIINQTLKDIEIILVNDGSTDGSKKIIQEYKKKDKRIISLEKENGGQGSARNLGLKKAKGDYIVFVDSDDWIENDMLEIMYNKALSCQSDIVVCDYYKVKDDVKESCKAFDTYGTSLMENCILNSSGPCWKMIKRNIIIDNNLYFPEGIIYEDYAVVPLYFLFADKISYVERPLYNYFIRKGSTMNQEFNNKLYDIVDATNILFRRLEQYGFPYYQEYEYFIIKNIFREAYIRLKEFDEGYKVLDYIVAWAKVKIPNWYKNKYFKEEKMKKRIFTYLIYKRQYKLLA